MNPYLNVPFLPDEGYTSFLAERRQYIDTIQFSLPSEKPLDSRVRLNGPESEEQMRLLAGLGGLRKYALLNSRFYEPSLFRKSDTLQQLINLLAQYLEQGIINGIVFCDYYLLQCIADEAPEVAAGLEAVPGVNMILDSTTKIEALIEYIGESRFKLPGKIILDRNLNRDLDKLARMAYRLRQEYPEMQLEVLANEGCLLHCPYKLSHDAYISLSNQLGCDHTHHLNYKYGCMRLIDEKPQRIFQSPFIRPEDVDLYLYHIDVIKICGRTLGVGFLQQAIDAYCEKKFTGNLLELLDAMHWLSDKLYVDNQLLSFDFADMLSVCGNSCESCGFCKDLFQTVTHPITSSLPDQRKRS